MAQKTSSPPRKLVFEVGARLEAMDFTQNWYVFALCRVESSCFALRVAFRAVSSKVLHGWVRLRRYLISFKICVGLLWTGANTHKPTRRKVLVVSPWVAFGQRLKCWFAIMSMSQVTNVKNLSYLQPTKIAQGWFIARNKTKQQKKQRGIGVVPAILGVMFGVCLHGSHFC